MNENEKNANLGEPISEEQLDAVTGGEKGAQMGPRCSGACWFQADGGPREDGRVRCHSDRHCMGKFRDSGGHPVSPGAIEASWWRCHSWGTNSCIDRWHLMDHTCAQEVRPY